jgi:serine/threonine protein kinase
LGLEDDESKEKNQKMIEKEIRVGILVSKECRYLVSYTETFEWEKFFCIKMEYFSNGDLQFQLDNGRIFTEEV